MMGMGEEPRNIYKAKNKEKSPVWCPSHTPVYEKKWMSTVFRCPKTPKTSRTYPRLDGGPSVIGLRKIVLGSVWFVYIVGNVNYIHMNFQDLQ